MQYIYLRQNIHDKNRGRLGERTETTGAMGGGVKLVRAGNRKQVGSFREYPL